MEPKRMLAVAPAPSEAERLDKIKREAIEHINARLTDEIAPQLRAEIVAEVKGTLDDTRNAAFAHGHAAAMAKAWRYLVGGALAGFVAAVLTYGVASLNGGYLASMERKNDEIRRMLDQ